MRVPFGPPSSEPRLQAACWFFGTRISTAPERGRVRRRDVGGFALARPRVAGGPRPRRPLRTLRSKPAARPLPGGFLSGCGQPGRSTPALARDATCRSQPGRRMKLHPAKHGRPTSRSIPAPAGRRSGGLPGNRPGGAELAVPRAGRRGPDVYRWPLRSTVRHGGRHFGDFIVWRKDDTPAYQLGLPWSTMRRWESRGCPRPPICSSRRSANFCSIGHLADPASVYHCPLLDDEHGVAPRQKARRPEPAEPSRPRPQPGEYPGKLALISHRSTRRSRRAARRRKNLFVRCGSLVVNLSP